MWVTLPAPGAVPGAAPPAPAQHKQTHSNTNRAPGTGPAPGTGRGRAQKSHNKRDYYGWLQIWAAEPSGFQENTQTPGRLCHRGDASPEVPRVSSRNGRQPRGPFPAREKEEAGSAPGLSRTARDFPLQMRGRKQRALRPGQERLLVVFLRAVMASPELPEPRDERPARSGWVGVSRVTQRTRGDSPVPARAWCPLPVPAHGDWEQQDPSSNEGKTNRSLKTRRKGGVGVQAALQRQFGTSFPLLLNPRPNLEPAGTGHGAAPAPGRAQSPPCLSQLGSTLGNCETFSVLQGEAPPGWLLSLNSVFQELFWGVREGGRVFAL